MPLDSGDTRCKNVFMPETVIVIASGDLRLSANRVCWPAQARAEEAVMEAIRREGREVRRGHPCNSEKGHGFIDSQKYGMEVFRSIPETAPLVVVEAVWQYSHHVLSGLYTHRGPILTAANWSGEWPGLVGMLNLNASAHESRCDLQHAVERGFYGCVLSAGTARVARRRGRAARSQPRSTAGRIPASGGGGSARRAAGAGPAAVEGDHGDLRRGLHGHV